MPVGASVNSAVFEYHIPKLVPLGSDPFVSLFKMLLVVVRPLVLYFFHHRLTEQRIDTGLVTLALPL